MLSVKGVGIRGNVYAFPWLLTAALSAALIALLFVAVTRRRTFGAGRVDVVLLLAPFGLILATLIVSTWNIYARAGGPAGLQGRYLFAALPGVFAVAALVLARAPGFRSRPGTLPAVVASGALVFVVACLHRAMSFHWGVDNSSLTGAPRGVVAWAPVPVWVGAAVAVALVIASLTLFVQLANGLRGSRPIDASDRPVDRAADPRPDTSFVDASPSGDRPRSGGYGQRDVPP